MASSCDPAHTFIKKTVRVQILNAESVMSAHDVLTVWVHGTRNPIFRKIHASPEGLYAWDNLPSEYGLKKVAEALHEHDVSEFHIDNFYTFGWSGLLSFFARDMAGKDFNRAIRDLKDQHFKQHAIIPRIRVITHSHGCNVVLSAADQLLLDEPVMIDELVLLACPVQQATVQQIQSPAFKNIYSLYSTIDLTQVLDPQGLNIEKRQSNGKLFSERQFPSQPNLVQAQIRRKGFALTHGGFVRQRFGTVLPSILATLRPAQKDTSYIIDWVN